MLETVVGHSAPVQLMLGAFTTIDQKIVIFNLQDLSRVVPAVERAAGAATEGGELHKLKNQDFCYLYSETG